ncbi:MAG: MnmC family methyltransferase [Hydrogenobaculum sp.]
MEKSLKEQVLTTLRTDNRFYNIKEHLRDVLLKEVSNIYKPNIHSSHTNQTNLYDEYYNEFYHSITTGPLEEAYSKFVNPVLGFLKEKSVINVLDIGSGMFVNSGVLAYELLKLNKTINIVSIDKKLPPFIALNHASDEIRYLLYESNFSVKSSRLTWQVILKDARTIKTNTMFDIILHDGFSPYKNPSLWTLDFLYILYKSLKQEGIWISYTSNKSVQSSLNFLNFKIDFVEPVGRKRPSMMAFKTAKHKSNIDLQNPYAIPMRDITLSADEDKIISDYFIRVYILKSKYYSPSKD